MRYLRWVGLGSITLVVLWAVAAGRPGSVSNLGRQPLAHAAPGAIATPAPTPSVGIADPDVVVTPAPLPRPAYNTAATDPVFGTTLRRITDETVGDPAGYGTHIYSQLQAFSPTNEYVLLIESGNFVARRLSDLAAMPGEIWNAAHWQPALPSTIVHYDSNADETINLLYTDVETGQMETVFTFPAQYDRIRLDQSWDELSRDGRWMAGMATQGTDQVLFVLDLEARALGAELSLSALYSGPCAPDPTWGNVEPDWVGVSPLGNYLVVQWKRDGETRCSGLESFDLQTGAFVGRAYDGHQHGDLGVLPDGREFFMTFEFGHPSGSLAIGYRVLPGPATGVAEQHFLRTIAWGIDGHISCQGPNGVCLVTTWNDASDGWVPFEGELFFQYTDGSVLRLAHSRSSGCGYWVQPRASLSRDGRYLIFASDWAFGTGSDSCTGGDLGHGEAYVINLGAGPPATPTATVPPTLTPTGTTVPPTPAGANRRYLPVMVR